MRILFIFVTNVIKSPIIRGLNHIEILYLEILAELGVDWEIFLDKLA